MCCADAGNSKAPGGAAVAIEDAVDDGGTDEGAGGVTIVCCGAVCAEGATPPVDGIDERCERAAGGCVGSVAGDAGNG